jgi:hypothetical protein
MRTARALVVCLPVLAGMLQPALAEKPRLEYRAVHAPARDLGRRLEAAGREGFSCMAVARPDPGAAPPGVVVLLGRAVGGAPSAVAHRVVAGGWAGTDLEAPLEKAGAEGFRLCGVVLDEEPPNPALVAVMSRAADSPIPTHYGVEVLTNYKDSLVRLNARAGEGFVPVAAAPVNNSRVPEMRAWMVVIERTGAGAGPRDVAVRSNSGPDGFQKALNEQGSQGYRVDLIWKEGNDAVAMMSRPRGSAKDVHAYTVDAAGFSRIHSFSGLYLADVSHRSDERLVIGERGASASNDVENDPLPPLSKLGTADAEALEVLGNHLSRHRGFAPASARIHRGPGGTFFLATVLTERGP